MFQKKPVDLDHHPLTLAEVKDFQRLLLTAFRDAAKTATYSRNDQGRPHPPHVEYAADFFNTLQNVERYMQEMQENAAPKIAMERKTTPLRP